MEQDEEQHLGRTGRRMLTESIQGSFIWNMTRRRSCGDHIHTPVGGRLPNLVCLGCKFPGILNILSHPVGADVWGQVVEEEAPEHKLSHARVIDIRAWYL